MTKPEKVRCQLCGHYIKDESFVLWLTDDNPVVFCNETEARAWRETMNGGIANLRAQVDMLKKTIRGIFKT